MSLSRARSISSYKVDQTELEHLHKMAKKKGEQSKYMSKLTTKIKKAYDFRMHITSQFQKAMNQCIFIRVEGIIVNASFTSFQRRTREKRSTDSNKAATAIKETMIQRYKDDAHTKSVKHKTGSVGQAQNSYIHDLNKSTRRASFQKTKTGTQRKSTAEISEEVLKLERNVRFATTDKATDKDSSLYQEVVKESKEGKQEEKKKEKNIIKVKRGEKHENNKKEETNRKEEKKSKDKEQTQSDDISEDYQSVIDLTDEHFQQRGLGTSRTRSGSIYYDVITAEDEYDQDYQIALKAAAHSNVPMAFMQSLEAPVFSIKLPQILVTQPSDQDQDRTNNKLSYAD